MKKLYTVLGAIQIENQARKCPTSTWRCGPAPTSPSSAPWSTMGAVPRVGLPQLRRGLRQRGHAGRGGLRRHRGPGRAVLRVGPPSPGSFAAAAGGLAMRLVPVAQAGPGRAGPADGGCGCGAGRGQPRGDGAADGAAVERALPEGCAGAADEDRRGLTVTGGVLSVLPRRSRAAALSGGAACVGGSVVTRFAVSRPAWLPPPTRSTRSSRRSEDWPSVPRGCDHLRRRCVVTKLCRVPVGLG